MNEAKTKLAPQAIGEILIYLLVILVYPFLFIRLGQEYTDGPFHMMSYIGLRSPSWMTSLQTALGTAWMRVTGDYVISYRILTRVLVWIAMVIPTCIVVGFKKNSINTLRCLAISVILMTNMFLNNLSWDTLSYFLIAVIYALSAIYLFRDKSIMLVFIGVICGILGLVRFPSLFIILPLIVLIAFKNTNERPKWEIMGLDAVLMTIPSIIVYYLLSLWLRGMYPASVLHGSGTEGSGLTTAISQIIHAIVPLGYRYVNESMRVLELLGILTLLALMWSFRKEITKKHFWVVSALIFIVSLYFVMTLLRSPYGRHLWLFLASISLVLICYSMWKSKSENEGKYFIFFMFSFMIGPVSVIGSDTGLYRLFMGYSFVLPLAMIYATAKLGNDMKKGLTLLLGLAVFFSIINKTFFNTAFDDGKLFQLTAEIDHPKMKGIRTIPARKQHIESMLAVTDSIHLNDPGAEVLYYGTSSHLMSYLTNSSRPMGYFFAMRFDVGEYLSTHVSSDSAPDYVFCVTGYPERDFSFNSSIVEELLSNNGYDKINKGHKYIVYRKAGQTQNNSSMEVTN